MSKLTVYILTGLPYSGKTTLIRELVKRFGFKVASMDEIMNEKHMDPDTMSMDDWGKVYSEGYNRLKKYLSEGYSAVLDCGNLKRNERETPKQIAESLGANWRLIYLNISKEEAKERWMKNHSTKERDELTDQTMNAALDMFVEPTPDEGAIIYNQQMDLDQWIKENID
ncbi:hypothetical protein A2721_03125 [Candidatus Gottesmanbacteria bacterium RIFCSPHIGHO2_01_FULL_47_48]|uniref:Kinase n=1 Tax=Candidatus Gottesmanbacteria bacterium RIFCSPHIGHO2_01_FULL_47_48 TaxID=1798381 RepID=A0A1F5ZYY5_9BACT|nr:MAG: hypothetical protein A2721_03125 [Candidatus Gottesmanbacteria bacterium RIFCSPHIGHO2_01_FULL_47_48]